MGGLGMSPGWGMLAWTSNICHQTAVEGLCAQRWGCSQLPVAAPLLRLWGSTYT